MLQGHFYHYTSYSAARDIFENDTNNGLRPSCRFIPMSCGNDLPDKAYTGVIWGMLSERHPGFLKKYLETDLTTLFHQTIEKAREHRRPTFLLRAHVLESDDIYVAEYGVHHREDYSGVPFLGNYRDCARGYRDIVNEVKANYWDSLVPFFDYETDMYQVPEVICFNPIPLDRLEIYKVIPGSEMARYEETGEFDPEALHRDKEKREESARRASDMLTARLR